MEFLGLVPPSTEHALNDYHPSSAVPASPNLKFTGLAEHRAALDEAMSRIKAGFTLQSPSGHRVKFGEILHGHLLRTQDAHRARFLPAAEQTVINPVEVWEDGLRHNFIGRFQKADGHFAFVVVAARRGETSDEAITILPKKEKELKKFRKGTLIYRMK